MLNLPNYLYTVQEVHHEKISLYQKSLLVVRMWKVYIDLYIRTE